MLPLSLYISRASVKAGEVFSGQPEPNGDLICSILASIVLLDPYLNLERHLIGSRRSTVKSIEILAKRTCHRWFFLRDETN